MDTPSNELSNFTLFQVTGCLPAADTMAQATAKHLEDELAANIAAKDGKAPPGLPNGAAMFRTAWREALHDAAHAKIGGDMDRARAALLRLHDRQLQLHGL